MGANTIRLGLGVASDVGRSWDRGLQLFLVFFGRCGVTVMAVGGAEVDVLGIFRGRGIRGVVEMGLAMSRLVWRALATELWTCGCRSCLGL